MQQFTEQQLDAIEQTGKMLSGVLMELNDPTGVGGVECDLLDQIHSRLEDIENLCTRTIQNHGRG